MNNEMVLPFQRVVHDRIKVIGNAQVGHHILGSTIVKMSLLDVFLFQPGAAALHCILHLLYTPAMPEVYSLYINKVGPTLYRKDVRLLF